MSLSVLFWVIWIVAILFTGFVNWPANRSWGGWIVVFVLLAILGYAQFGSIVK